MAEAFGEDLFSAFDEDASTSRPLPSTSSRDDHSDDKVKSEDDSNKRFVDKISQMLAEKYG